MKQVAQRLPGLFVVILQPHAGQDAFEAGAIAFMLATLFREEAQTR